MSTSGAMPVHRLPFEIAELQLLSPAVAKRTLERFEFLAEFLMHAASAATITEKYLLLRAIETLQEIA